MNTCKQILILLFLIPFIGCSTSGYITTKSTSEAKSPIIIPNKQNESFGGFYENRKQKVEYNGFTYDSTDDYSSGITLKNNNYSFGVIGNHRYNQNWIIGGIAEYNQSQLSVITRYIFEKKMLINFQIGPILGVSYAHSFTEYEPHSTIFGGPDYDYKGSSFDVSIITGLEGHIIKPFINDHINIMASSEIEWNGPIGNEYTGNFVQGNISGGLSLYWFAMLQIQAGYGYVVFNDSKYDVTINEKYPFVNAQILLCR